MGSGTKSDEAQFENVNWDELERSWLDVPMRTAAVLVTLAVMAAGIMYDMVIVPSERQTFPALNWEVASLDWLFMFTLAMLFFYGVWPLYSNQRMTRYYWNQFKKNKAAVVSLGYLLIVFVVGTVGPLVIEPPTLDIMAQYQPPVFTETSGSTVINCVGEATADGGCMGSWKYPLGTTGQGKGILASVIFGMRVSMQVGLITTLILIVIGTAVGSVAAYSGGFVDELLMRYVDIQLTFPTFFLYLLLIYLYGGTLFLMIIIFGLTSWGGTARLVRSEALQRREEEYVRASESAGANEGWIIRKHLVPNVSNTVITNASLLIPSLILFEAALSFLGLGDPTVSSWGRVIATGRGDLDVAWWISTIPGVFLFLTVLAFNFLGDALRDALDPRSEH